MESSGKTQESKLVQMRLQPKTLERIENLSEITGTDNRTQLVAASVQLAEEIFRSVKEGGQLYIEKKDGTKELIKIVGL